MTGEQPRHVFISYVRENKDLVDRLCDDLKAHGVNVWLDRQKIKPGVFWKDAIAEAIQQGDFFIACFSKEYKTRTHTKRKQTYMNEELTLAIDELRQYALDREWFIPVLLNECKPPLLRIGRGQTLLDLQWVPLYEDWNVGIKKILSVNYPIPPEIYYLISALRSENRDIRNRAVNAFRKLSRPSSVPALINTLKQGDKKIIALVAIILRKIGSAAVPALINSLKDKNEHVSLSAALALEKINTPKAQKALEEYKKQKSKDFDTLLNSSGALSCSSKFKPHVQMQAPNPCC